MASLEKGNAKAISRESGFSLSTVTKVLGGNARKYHISQKTEKIIRDTAVKMGYLPNISASTMRRGISPDIGIICRVTTERNQIISGILQTAIKYDLGVKIFELDKLDAAFEGITRNQIRKIISFSVEHDLREKIAAICKEHHYDLVFIYEHGIGNFPAVNVDVYNSYKEMVHRMLELGHRRIAYVCAKHRDVYFLDEGHRGYEDAFREYGLTPDPALCICREDREECVNRLLDLPEGKRPTAFCCVADPYAMMVERCILKKGFRVPEDISVTGFGKFGMEQFAYSPLTTIDNGFQTLGEVAAEVLLGHPVPYPKSEHGVYLIPGKIVLRESLTEVRKNKTGKEKKGKVR